MSKRLRVTRAMVIEAMTHIIDNVDDDEDVFEASIKVLRTLIDRFEHEARDRAGLEVE